MQFEEVSPEAAGGPAPSRTIRGAALFEGMLDAARQAALVEDIRRIAEVAPFFAPTTRFGQKMSVKMTAAGRYGWYSDARGYRYEPRHPGGGGWPAIPDSVLAIWARISGVSRAPECCLVNYYGKGARMGLHQDRDEADFRWPVVSVSLGDEALFRIGNETRGGATENLWLRSGDVLVMGGPARLLHHGIDRIAFGTSTLLPQGGRINLTLRVVD